MLKRLAMVGILTTATGGVLMSAAPAMAGDEGPGHGRKHHYGRNHNYNWNHGNGRHHGHGRHHGYWHGDEADIFDNSNNILQNCPDNHGRSDHCGQSNVIVNKSH